MRRNGLLVGGWAMATLLALVLGLQGIRSVSNSVTDHRPAPLSPSSVRAALQRTSTSTSTTVASASTATSAASDQPAASVSSSDVVVPSVNGDVGSTASDGPPASIVINGASTDSSAPSTSTSDDRPDNSSSSQPTSESSAPYTDRVYQLKGGSVAVRFQNDAAHLLWATPNRDEGYAVDQAQENDGTVDVRFRNRETGAESRLRAYWDGGPQYEIEED